MISEIGRHKKQPDIPKREYVNSVYIFIHLYVFIDVFYAYYNSKV